VNVRFLIMMIKMCFKKSDYLKIRYCKIRYLKKIFFKLEKVCCWKAREFGNFNKLKSTKVI